MGRVLGAFGGEALLDCPGLRMREPARIGRPVGQLAPDHEGQRHGRQALDHEHPLPAVPAQQAVHLQQRAADRAAEDVGDAHAEQEVAGGACPVLAAEPVVQIEHHAREQAGLGRAEQHAHHVERGLARDEGHAGRQQAPGDHDARDPPARAHAVHHQVARHLEQRVAQEEQARAQAVGRGRDADVDRHVALGERDVRAIDEADHVGQHQQRHQLAEDQRIERGLLVGGGRVGRGPEAGAGDGGVCHRCLSLKSCSGEGMQRCAVRDDGAAGDGDARARSRPWPRP